MLPLLRSVVRATGGVTIFIVLIVGGWVTIGFLTGLAIRAAQFAMG